MAQSNRNLKASQIGYQESQPIMSGHVQQSSAICDTLQECLNLSARMRGDLFGEGEAIGDCNEAPRVGHVSGMLHDALDMVARLRNELEQINEKINPAKSGASLKGGR